MPARRRRPSRGSCHRHDGACVCGRALLGGRIRLALNVPVCFAPSPLLTRVTRPEIESEDLKAPLKVKVPASRPTFPMGNSTPPEKLT